MNIVLAECCKFPRRILAIVQTPGVGLGVRVPLSLWEHSSVNLYPANSFLLACSEHIQGLQTEAPWCGHLEAQLAARAFQAGAQWGASNGSGTSNAECP